MKYPPTLAAVALWVILAGKVFAQEVPPTPPVGEGTKAPEWTLPGSDGKTHSLSAALQEGPVVLAWFPRAYTRGCTIECKSLAENSDRIREFKASYFMASVDPIEDNTGFAEENQADFPILSDANSEVAERYGVLSRFGFARRETFYIGTDGTILAIDRKVNPATAAQDMIATLEQLGVEKR